MVKKLSLKRVVETKIKDNGRERVKRSMEKG